MRLTLIFFLWLISHHEALIMSNQGAETFLRSYGYLSNDSRSQSSQNLTSAISRYQRFLKLNITGNLTNETLSHMNSRRCGNPDVQGISRMVEARRFLSEELAPPLRLNISWKITVFPLKRNDNAYPENIRETVKRGVGLWSRVSNLEFHQTDSDTPDIEIKFQPPESHNENCHGFGEKNPLAHFVGGTRKPAKIHLNDNFYWTSFKEDEKVRNRVHLETLVAHEVGHVLGFAHSNMPDSIMFPAQLPGGPVDLSPEDITMVRERYGFRAFTKNDPVTSECPNSVVTKFENKRDAYCGIAYTQSYCRGKRLFIQSPWSGDLKRLKTKWTNTISSLFINPYCLIRFCVNENGKGPCKIMHAGEGGRNVTTLDSSFDNKVQSGKCYCY